MKSSKIFYSLMIAAIAAAFGAGYSLKKVTTVFVDVPRTQVDTLYVEVERVVLKHLPAVHDTVYTGLEVAHTDAVLESGGVRYGRLGVSYYMPPADWFDIDFDPAPLPTVTVTKYIEVKRKWYDNAYLTLGAGILAGVAISNIKE